MKKPAYITSSCQISNGIVQQNGTLLFEDRGAASADFLLSAYRHFGFSYPKFHKMDNLSKLGWLAAEVLLQDNITVSGYPPAETGVVLANASSSLDTDIKYQDSVKGIPSPALFVYTLPNIVIGEICIRHDLKGENAFFIFDDFNAGFMQDYVSNLINNDILQCCICGWVEMLGDAYKAVLYLVEKKGDLVFATENLNKIYQSENG